MDSTDLLADLQLIGAVSGSEHKVPPTKKQPPAPVLSVRESVELHHAVVQKLAALAEVVQDLQGLFQELAEANALEQGEEHASIREEA